MSFDNAYESLVEDNDETHWAYGTGFVDILSDVDHAVPDGVDAPKLAAYCLLLGDDALVMAQRLSAWCSWAPELEEDVALANIALDLLGQARLLYTRAAEADPSIRPTAAPAHVPAEDALAYFRDELDFRNVRLAEIDTGPGPAGDFAMTIARLLVFASWRLAIFARLTDTADPVLSAIAAKGIKELAYHRDHAAQWTIRLGDGTALSAERMRAGFAAIWPLVPELCAPHPSDLLDPAPVAAELDDVLDRVFAAARLRRPEVPAMAGVSGRTGRDGVHTTALGYLLAELQHIARSHPQAVW
ncbi:MAG TPA: 1,2-phenylacetyl-CoA epoxidase subunit PaaC [Pseudonocardiaceae bacterium]|jgi:ring-1,2-phenylacetyl-CoA epoxidase subunit PaaC|nr:1,2-phenylacetyl-CoA epoxidase subunit PaaC [Pseudonocardiaceae bacterium]